MAAGVVELAWHTAVTALAAPWLLALRWMSWAAGLQLSFLSSLGVVPAGFVPQSKASQQETVIAHMHLREDQYRQAIAELQEVVEAKEGDKKKALRCLKKTRLEVELLAEQLAQIQDMQDVQGAVGGSKGGGVALGSSGGPAGGGLPMRGVHASVALLSAASWWYYTQEFPPLQRKLVFTILSPLAWVYLTTLLSFKANPTGMTLMLCCVWALLGFIGGCALASPP